MSDLEVERFDEFLERDFTDEDNPHDRGILDGPINCPVCTFHIEDIDDAYVEILHNTDDHKDPDFGTIHHLEFAHLIHAPSVLNDPNPKWMPFNKRIQNNCLPPERNPTNRYDVARDLSYILFPVRAVTHVDKNSISWLIEGQFEVRYHLMQSGLPAWDDTVWGIRKLQRWAKKVNSPHK